MRASLSSKRKLCALHRAPLPTKSTPLTSSMHVRLSMWHSNKLPHAMKIKLMNLLRQAPAPELAALLRRSAEPLTPKFDRLSPFFALLELQQNYCVSAFCRLCMERQLYFCTVARRRSPGVEATAKEAVRVEEEDRVAKECRQPEHERHRTVAARAAVPPYKTLASTSHSVLPGPPSLAPLTLY